MKIRYSNGSSVLGESVRALGQLEYTLERERERLLSKGKCEDVGEQAPG